MNFSKTSTKEDLTVNARVLVKTLIKPIHKPLNPYQFNYKNYLKRLGIYRQVFLQGITLRQKPLQAMRNRFGTI